MRVTLFEPGRIVGTPGALAATTEEFRLRCLKQHLAGEWGELDAHDKAANDEAIVQGTRILSAYPLEGKVGSLWIITEADRSATTLLLPEEY